MKANILGHYRWQASEDVIKLEAHLEHMLQGFAAYAANDNEKPTARGAMQALHGFAQVLMGYVKASVADVAEQATVDYRVGLAPEDVEDLAARLSVTVERVAAALASLEQDNPGAAYEELQEALAPAEGVLLELKQLAVEVEEEEDEEETADNEEPRPAGPRLVL